MAVNGKNKPKGDAAGRDIRTFRRGALVNVVVSVIAATALVIVANVLIHMLSKRADVRWAMESQRKYRLSDSAKRILEQLDKPIRLTSIYAGKANNSDDELEQEYAGRVRDLLEEMRQSKSDVTVVIATTDSQAEQVYARLRDRLDQEAAAHRQVIADFQLLVSKQAAQYEQMSTKWKRYPEDGWLFQFGIPTSIERMARNQKRLLRETSAEFRQQMEGASLPDYPAMAEKLREVLTFAEASLESIRQELSDLTKLSEAAKSENGELLTKDAVACAKQLTAAVKAIGAEGSALPRNPGKALTKFAEALDKASLAARAATIRLNGLWTISRRIETVDGWRVWPGSAYDLYAVLRIRVQQLAEQAKGVGATYTPEKQREFIASLRKGLPRLQLTEQGNAGADAVSKLLAGLTTMDEAATKILADAGKDDYLADLIEPISKLLGRADPGVLKDPSGQQELVQQSREDRIVIIEVGDKTEIASFDDIWPVTPSRFGDLSDDIKRTFDGDRAISSRILSLAAEPFAEVVLTYYENMPEGQMRRYRQPVVGPIPSFLLDAARERLERANLRVIDWNLAQSIAIPEKTDELPRVLLILPPPEPESGPSPMGIPAPAWTPAHEKVLTSLIESGTPAIFLGCRPSPRGLGLKVAPHGMAGYLRESWGLEIATPWFIIRTERHPDHPGKFKFPHEMSLSSTPLSGFTDHPVGKPLGALPFHWLLACPIRRIADSNSGAVIEDILAVAKNAEGIWAETDIRKLILDAQQGRPITPNMKPEKADDDKDRPDDIVPPFALVVQATKQIGDKQARIIAMGVGLSFITEYVREPVLSRRRDGSLAEGPPPAGNLDLLVNSVYHLADKGEYIGAGPASVRPIRIGRSAATVVKIIFGLAWPLVVLLIGGGVMLIRRR